MYKYFKKYINHTIPNNIINNNLINIYPKHIKTNTIWEYIKACIIYYIIKLNSDVKYNIFFDDTPGNIDTAISLTKNLIPRIYGVNIVKNISNATLDFYMNKFFTDFNI